MADGVCFSIGVKATRKDALSLGICAAGGASIFSTHRLLRLDIGRDGSIYLTPMTQAKAKWNVGAAEWSAQSMQLLGKDVQTSAFQQLGSSDESKISFHASGYIRLGPMSAYRPPLRTVPQVEMLCTIHHGNPVLLPSLSTSEFNEWPKRKGHSLFPGVCLPGHVAATRLYIAPPSGFEAHKGFQCADFVLLQQNLIVEVGGMPPSFPHRAEGGHGYDLIVAMGLWTGGEWKGPLVLIPVTMRSDNPERGRSQGGNEPEAHAGG